MSKSDYLFREATNKLLDQLSEWDDFPAGLPADSELADSLDVSRFTVQKVIRYLENSGLIEKRNVRKFLLRSPLKADYLPVQEAGMPSRGEHIAQQLIARLTDADMRQGRNFKETELAREVNCAVGTIREILIRLERYGLIRKLPRRGWETVPFTRKALDELFEMRFMIESYALERIQETSEFKRFENALQTMLKQHRTFLQNRKEAGKDNFVALNTFFHSTVFSVFNSSFIRDFVDCFSFVWNAELQRSKLDLKYCELYARQHMRIIRALLHRDASKAKKSLRIHLDTVRRETLKLVP